MNIIPLPAFRDNYIWLLHDERYAVVVDPGDAQPVVEALERLQLSLSAILITHHHPDHIGGLAALLSRWPVPTYGPANEAIDGVSHPVGEGDIVRLAQPGISLRVMEVPAHTAGHIAFLADQASPGLLFCGDTLFSAGCGRLFEGSPAQLAEALARFAALPADTRVYCTHEYTLSNLAFARAAEPSNPARDAYQQRCETLRARGEPTLPSTIGLERDINPFLRPHIAGVIDAVTAQSGQRPVDSTACLAALRAWKDNF